MRPHITRTRQTTIAGYGSKGRRGNSPAGVGQDALDGDAGLRGQVAREAVERDAVVMHDLPHVLLRPGTGEIALDELAGLRSR